MNYCRCRTETHLTARDNSATTSEIKDGNNINLKASDTFVFWSSSTSDSAFTGAAHSPISGKHQPSPVSHKLVATLALIGYRVSDHQRSTKGFTMPSLALSHSLLLIFHAYRSPVVHKLRSPGDAYIRGETERQCTVHQNRHLFELWFVCERAQCWTSSSVFPIHF